jgi:hypothetical protein
MNGLMMVLQQHMINRIKKAKQKLRYKSAAKEIRTPTPFPALPPQGSASTNFAIAAKFLKSKFN